MAAKAKRKILFIINPISGIRKQQKKSLPSRIEAYLDQQKFDYFISYTQYSGHATVLTREAVENGFDVIVAVGGDGSINDIARCLIGKDVMLGIMPFGSGNGLARDLGISLNVKKALKVINDLHVRKIDAAQYGENRFFFSNVGIGFAANVAQRFSNHIVRGFFSYALAVILEFFHKQSTKIKVYINGRLLEREVAVFNVFNSNQYGYGVGLIPESRPDDGMLNVGILNKFSRWRFPWYAILVVLKKQHRIPHFESYEATTLKVINEHHEDWLLQIDGECHLYREDWDVKVFPLSLKVLAPASSHAKKRTSG